MYISLISPQVVNENIEDPNWRFFDCRFVLTEPEKKQAEFLEGHLPGAMYAHLNHDLASPPILGKTGRHPLPKIEDLTKTFSEWGINPSNQVVIYDDTGGIYAARLWWMLRWLGHNAVAVMDGGWTRWVKEERPVSADIFLPETVKFCVSLQEHLSVSAEDVLNYIDNPEVRVFDARSRERFCGENETLDPVAGHIPSAVSSPFDGNLDSDGNWKSKPALRKMYLELLNGLSADQTVTYCGSGITACHNILSMFYAELGDSRLYPGSWSDWITIPERPIA